MVPPVTCMQDLLDEVDRDGSGSCEYIEYVEIMTVWPFQLMQPVTCKIHAQCVHRC